MRYIVIFLFATLFVACLSNVNQMQNSEMYSKVTSLKAPIAKKQDHEMTNHGHVRNDEYYWMRLSDEQKNAEKPDEQTKEVVAYLELENEYTKEMMKHLDVYEEELFKEIKSRIKETDNSVPYKDNGYYYITKYEEGKEYPLYTRKKGTLEAAEEILIDVNLLAEGYEYYNVAGRSVSPDNKILAYGEDTVSRRIYTIKFKHLEDGAYLEDIIPNTTGGVVWANDNKTVFYATKDHALRSYKIFKHVLGTPVSQDQEVYHEADETFRTFVYKTKSKSYIVIGSTSTLTTEYRILNADEPTQDFQVFEPRERNHEYGVSHYNDKWYILTNKDGAKNFKLMETQINKTEKENWTNVIDHREDVLLENIDVFNDYLVLSERIEGLDKVRVINQKNKEDYYIDFNEETGVTSTSVNLDFDTDLLRINYTSMTTPSSVYDFNMKTKQKELLKQQEVLGSFNADDYKSARKMFKVRDGVEVPVSIVYHKDTPIDGTAPCLLYAYGSYGYSLSPYFSSVRLSLLNRGFVYAIAHIRGGEDLGRHWYESGKLLKKKNTFYDFIDCGKALIKSGYSAPDNLFAMGGSAGGLLMGAVMNMAPELWKGVVAQVPFVDVVTTMLDESIPLTTGEYDEWGNPNEKAYFDYMLSYSPIDNVEEKDYPATLVTTGYFDSQVQYWEPAKWVAKLRDQKTDSNPLLFKVNMGAGHGGASGRFKRLREVATEYAFITDLAQAKESIVD